jgi:hypothetical protein
MTGHRSLNSQPRPVSRPTPVLHVHQTGFRYTGEANPSAGRTRTSARPVGYRPYVAGGAKADDTEIGITCRSPGRFFAPTCPASRTSGCIHCLTVICAAGWADFDGHTAMLDALAYLEAARTWSVRAARRGDRRGWL